MPFFQHCEFKAYKDEVFSIPYPLKKLQNILANGKM
jgi:hypothetical protein